MMLGLKPYLKMLPGPEMETTSEVVSNLQQETQLQRQTKFEAMSMQRAETKLEVKPERAVVLTLLVATMPEVVWNWATESKPEGQLARAVVTPLAESTPEVVSRLEAGTKLGG